MHLEITNSTVMFLDILIACFIFMKVLFVGNFVRISKHKLKKCQGNEETCKSIDRFAFASYSKGLKAICSVTSYTAPDLPFATYWSLFSYAGLKITSSSFKSRK